MEKEKKFNKIFVGMAIVLMLTLILLVPTYAGYCEHIIDGSTCEKELNGGVWYNPDEDVIGKNGIITFGKDSTDASRVITKDVASISEQNDNLLSANFTLDFKSMPKSKEFIFAMGLQSVAAVSGEKDNLEVVFGNDGTKYVKVIAYTENEKAYTVLKKARYISNNPTVEIRVSTNKKMSLVIDGKEYYNGKIPVTGEGSMGFLQTGQCEVNVKDFKLVRYSYDRPNAPNFEENFDNGYFNLNVLRSKVLSGSNYSPSYMRIEEYNGNNVLKINNTGICYISTKYSYSNFEMTFDIPFYQYQSVYNDKGELTQPGTRELAVCFGADGSEFTNESGYTEATDLFVFTNPTACYNIRTNESFTSDISADNAADGKPFSVKLSVIDGQVELYFRMKGEKQWHICASYKLSFTPTGTIAIWAPTGSCTNYAIDNIKVVNKDKDANLVSVEYKSSKINIPKDFEYTALELNYKQAEETDDKKDTTNYTAVYIVGAICIVIIIISAVLINFSKKKGVQTDEKK